jgi:hypothetical protein
MRRREFYLTFFIQTKVRIAVLHQDISISTRKKERWETKTINDVKDGIKKNCSMYE